jgi:hypothetical protein
MKKEEIDWDCAWWQPDYKYWLDHELLTLIEISFIAAGQEPVSSRKFFDKPQSFKNPHEIYHLLLSAIEAGKISGLVEAGNTYKAPTVEWLRYLIQKKILLPKDLLSCAEGLIAEHRLQAKEKREKKSYLSTETRDDDLALEAVLRTLLDLAPDMPKRDLIHLKPIKEYANGAQHSEDKLLKIITKIEGGKRAGGRPSNNKIEKTTYAIPQFW